MKTSIEQQIPPKRIALYTVIGSFICVLTAFLWSQSVINEAEDQCTALQTIGQRIRTKVAHQEHNRQVIQRFKGKDSLFLHRHLGSFSLLSTEIAAAKERLSKSALPEDIQLEKRVTSLSSGENVFSFVEGQLEIGPYYRETVEQQSKQVELDTEDLTKVLTLIEEPEETTPHLIIADARLERKKSFSQEVWGVTLQVIRREYQ